VRARVITSCECDVFASRIRLLRWATQQQQQQMRFRLLVSVQFGLHAVFGLGGGGCGGHVNYKTPRYPEACVQRRWPVQQGVGKSLICLARTHRICILCGTHTLTRRPTPIPASEWMLIFTLLCVIAHHVDSSTRGRGSRKCLFSCGLIDTSELFKNILNYNIKDNLTICGPVVAHAARIWCVSKWRPEMFIFSLFSDRMQISHFYWTKMYVGQTWCGG
jgi:hypothetical protein